MSEPLRVAQLSDRERLNKLRRLKELRAKDAAARRTARPGGAVEVSDLPPPTMSAEQAPRGRPQAGAPAGPLGAFRQRYPQYDDMSDAQLADALYRKHYSGMDRSAFDRRLGLAGPSAGVRADRTGSTRPDGAAGGQSTASGVIDSFTDGAAFGFGDSLTALESAVLGRTPDGDWLDYRQPFDERYDRALAAERGQNDAFAAANPITDTAASIGGAVAGGAGLAARGLSLMGRAGGSMGRQALAGGLEGAVYGAAHGAGAADGEEIGDAARQGAILGGALGAPLAAAGTGLSNAFRRRVAASRSPSPMELKAAADLAYQAARQRNPVVPGFNTFAQQARDRMKVEGFHKRLHPRVHVTLSEADRMAAGPVDFRRTEQLRQLTQSAARSADDSEKRLGVILRNQLDDFVERNAPVPEVREGRELYRRWKNVTTLQDAITEASRSGGSGSTGFTTRLRGLVRSILNSPKKRRGFNADEIEAMDAFIRGGPVGNVLSMVGKLSPTAGTLPLAANFGAAALEPTALAATAAAAGARGGGDAITKLNADVLSAILAGGSVPRASASRSAAAAVRAMASETGDKR